MGAGGQPKPGEGLLPASRGLANVGGRQRPGHQGEDGQDRDRGGAVPRQPPASPARPVYGEHQESSYRAVRQNGEPVWQRIGQHRQALQPVPRQQRARVPDPVEVHGGGTEREQFEQCECHR